MYGKGSFIYAAYGALTYMRIFALGGIIFPAAAPHHCQAVAAPATAPC